MKQHCKKLFASLAATALTLTLLPFSPALAADGDQTVLVLEGLPQSTIVTSGSPSSLEQEAANELSSYFQQISGATVPITADASLAEGIKIYVGNASPSKDANVEAILTEGGNNPDAFRLLISDDAVHLNGVSDKGTLYAAYELLEQVGVRWFMPGDIGTVIPSKATIELPVQDTIQHPAFNARAMAAVEGYQKVNQAPAGINYTEGAPWVRHNRLNQQFYGKEGWPANFNKQKNPEFFLKNADGSVSNFIDTRNETVIDLIVAGSITKLKADPSLKILNMGPVDGVLPITYDPEWDGSKDEYDAKTGARSASDRMVKFFNIVLDRLSDAGYPDVSIAFFAYTNCQQPPVKYTANSRLIPVIASITMDRLHAMGNDLSWERNQQADTIAGWQQAGASPLIYQYLFNLADPGLPFSMINQVSSEFRYYKDNGVTGIRAETLPAWGYHGPSLYLAAKMMWDADLDVEALLDDYFTQFYGPAAEPMRAHFDILEAAFADADYFAGSVYDFQNILNRDISAVEPETDLSWKDVKNQEKEQKKQEKENGKHNGKHNGKGKDTYEPETLPLTALRQMDQVLQEAEALAAESGNSVYVQRVNMVRVAFDFGDSFLGMIKSMNEFNFVDANAYYGHALELREQAVLNSPVILNPYANYTYIDWFWKNYAPQAAQRVTNGNTLLAELPDEWDAMLYPDKFGNRVGLWKPELGTNAWTKLKTYSETWSDQGLRYYRGYMWYRTTVDVPENPGAGESAYLWIGMLDEAARVWLNGKEIPKVQGGSLMTPFEFNATDAIRYGESNVIAVEVQNLWLDELGTGGIMGPAFLWQGVR